MNQTVISGGDHRYLSELPEFQDGLPHGVINKTKPDCGGTWVAANCKSNYIIVCPFRDLVDSIEADKNNKYKTFKCYGGTKQYEYEKYFRENKVRKIAVTYDSLPKLMRWMNDVNNYKLVVDEYHLILEDIDYREDAIMGLIENVNKFTHYSFLSATPIDDDLEIAFFKKLPHYKVIWNNLTKIKIFPYQTSNTVRGVTNLIACFLQDGIIMPNKHGVETKVESLFIFLNSVTSIQQIVSTLELDPSIVKVSCADRLRNRILINKYEIEAASTELAPNKKINFFTKKGFQGCNMFTDNGLIVVASDGNRDSTLVDISTTLEQIAGRLRDNKNYHNVFRNSLIHIYSKSNHMQTDDEFEKMMIDKANEGELMIRGWKKMDDKERRVYSKNLKLDKQLVSIVNGKMQFNELKRQSFIFKHKLKNQYKDQVSIIRSYESTNKFVASDDNLKWECFDVQMKKALTVSYKQLLNSYLDHPSKEYDWEYPEFRSFRKWLTKTEMNSLRWNKNKMMKSVEDKKKLNQAFSNIYKQGKFMSNKDLKEALAEQFTKLGIDTFKPKATLIKNQTMCRYEKTSKTLNGKKINGYRFQEITISFNYEF